MPSSPRDAQALGHRGSLNDRGRARSAQRHPPSDPPLQARLVIVTEVRLFREGIARIVADGTPHISVDTAVPDGTLESRLADLKPDVVLLDAATIRRHAADHDLRAIVPGSRLVAFAVTEDEHDVIACARAGVVGFVERDAPVDDLLAAIEAALHGQPWCSARVAASMCARLVATAHAPSADDEWLTGRERQVLDLVDQGLSNKEIAERLSIEVSTVKNHVHNLLEKLRVKHRWQAAAVVRRSAPRIRPAAS
jgi:DNA-binding NarL/FixJ family response regulator